MTTSQSEEILITEWQEPERIKSPFTSGPLFKLILGTLFFVVLCIVLGFMLKEVSFYVASTVVAMGALAIIVQKRRDLHYKQIQLTNQRLIIDQRNYALSDLAGFWLENDINGLVVTIEHKEPTLIPITFFFANQDEATAKQVLLQLFPELEPRSAHFTDSLSRYFRI